MPKYKDYFLKMMADHEDEFKQFKIVHDGYALNEVSQTEYNEAGRKIQDIIRDYEDRLCGHSESSQYGKFSSTLADKFWDLLRAEYPKIDYIGILK